MKYATEKEILKRYETVKLYYTSAVNRGSFPDAKVWKIKMDSLMNILSILCNNRI